MLISDLSSDVCSSDLRVLRMRLHRGGGREQALGRPAGSHGQVDHLRFSDGQRAGLVEDDDAKAGTLFDGFGVFEQDAVADRKSVVKGKSVSVRVDLVGRRIIKIKTYN